MTYFPVKTNSILWFLLLTVVCISPISFAADKQAPPAANDILQQLGHTPLVGQSESQKPKVGSKTNGAESDFTPPLMEHHVHTVKAGENLSSIVKLYYNDTGKIKTIAEYNKIKNVNQLKVGQKIKIPALEMKADSSVSGFKETDLGGAAEMKVKLIESADLNRSGILSKTIFMLLILLILAGIALAVYIFMIKPPPKQNTNQAEESLDGDVPVEKPFVLGNMNGEDNQRSG